MDATRPNHRKLFSNAAVAIAVLMLPGVLVICGGFGQSANVDVEATIAAGIQATQQTQAILHATVEAGVEATQAAQLAADQLSEPTVSVTLLPTTTIPDPQQVRSVILNEVSGSIAQDLALLRSLYAPDAVVTDRNGTPDDPSDDTTWRGWVNIGRRYQAFFSAGFSSSVLVDLSIQIDGDRATGTHQGVVLDGTLYPDIGVYTLEKSDGQWLITQLEYGNVSGYDSLVANTDEGASTDQAPRDDGLYVLELGSQHRYEEPWGWDRGDPCGAWATNNFDDTKPNYRGFNVELLLTNNSDTKVPDDWPMSFTTAKGKSVKACYYGYDGSGPVPGATSSVTFFTVVEQGDYVETITFSLNGQTIRLCLDGKGGWLRCKI